VSRIGKKPIAIPDKVQVSVQDNVMKAKGPKGELELKIPTEIDYKIENKELVFSRKSDEKHIRALHGLTRALGFNVVEGVINGFSITLQIEGVGYKAELRGKKLSLAMGFSHPVLIIPPDGITLEVPNVTTVKINGIDKQLVGQVAAKIRQIRPPEPYKGKGIRYEGEYVRRKAGKTAAK
jgi:large subunit ribosomal protein L6